QIRSALAAELHGDFDRASRFRRFVLTRFEAGAYQGFDFRMGVQAWIEVHQQGGKRRMQVENAARAFQTSRETAHVTPGRERDFVAEMDKERAVARGADRHCRDVITA